MNDKARAELDALVKAIGRDTVKRSTDCQTEYRWHLNTWELDAIKAFPFLWVFLKTSYQVGTGSFARFYRVRSTLPRV